MPHFLFFAFFIFWCVVIFVLFLVRGEYVTFKGAEVIETEEDFDAGCYGSLSHRRDFFTGG